MRTPDPYKFIFLLLFCMQACQEPSTKNVDAQTESIIQIRPNQDSQHMIDDIPTFTQQGHVNAVIEIPAGGIEKWEVSKETGQLFLEKINGKERRIQYLAYPTNYGMIPQTLLPESKGGDGDPVDVLVMGEAIPRGKIVPCRIIGAINMLDNGEQDDKLLAVRTNDHFSHIPNLDQLQSEYPGVLDILSTWFKNYKGKNVEILGVSDVVIAQKVLEAAHKDYMSTRNK